MADTKKPLGTYHLRKICRFCGSHRLAMVLDLGRFPLAGGFLKPERFTQEKFYPLTLAMCEVCSLVQVREEVDASTLFKNYFYFSSSIKTLVAHCADFAQEVTDRFLRSTGSPSVLEIGCNDGVMLRPFAQLGVKTVGIDPAVNVVASIQDKDFDVINDFFNERSAVKIAQQYRGFDAIVSSYSFAHIDDMIGVIKGVKRLLKPQGVFVFEVYYLGTLLDEMQYDMIYHEHLSYYSLKSLAHFLGSHDMEIFEVKFTPGVRSGAVRFYARHKNKRTDPIDGSVVKLAQQEKDRGYNGINALAAYGQNVVRARERLLALLDQIKRQGKTIIGYGASGRGTIIMNYCGIDGRYLDYVVDDAPAKHGFYTPGTHVIIHPWEHAREKRPDYALLFAWSFINEVRQRRQDYLQAGGQFIVPLPEVSVVGL